MKITINNFTIYNENNTLRATADVTLGKTITINGVKIVEGQKGIFVAMPTRKENDKFVPVCKILDANVFKEVTEIMIEQYKKSGRMEDIQDDF